MKKPTDFPVTDRIKAVEPVGLITESDKLQTKVKADHYSELKADKKYVMFLKKNTFGQYSLINMNNGKFNLDGTDVSDLTQDGESGIKMKLKQQIESKFGL
ncbi:hypothetical protein [Cohnella endophytica]|nr:hypothetical protein [Cohnella endophytica]